MTKREKQILARIYSCTLKLGGGPSNPMDVRAVVQALDRTNKALQPLSFAISNLGYGDLDDAVEDLEDAEQILGIKATP